MIEIISVNAVILARSFHGCSQTLFWERLEGLCLCEQRYSKGLWNQLHKLSVERVVFLSSWTIIDEYISF